MQLCRVRSCAVTGIPRDAIYEGAAHSSRRFAASRRATTRVSGGSPNRMQTSNASSVSGGGVTDN